VIGNFVIGHYAACGENRNNQARKRDMEREIIGISEYYLPDIHARSLTARFVLHTRSWTVNIHISIYLHDSVYIY
jgi:hypothetical protein